LLLPPRFSDPGTGTATVCSQLGKIPYLSLCPSLFFFFVRLPFSFKFYVSLDQVCNWIFWCSTSVAYNFHTIWVRYEPLKSWIDFEIASSLKIQGFDSGLLLLFCSYSRRFGVTLA
jgi:hypothetical protein